MVILTTLLLLIPMVLLSCGAEGAHFDPFKDIDGKAYNLSKGARNVGTDAEASYVDPSKDVDGKAFNLGKGARVVGSSDAASSDPASNGNVQSSPFGKGNASTSNGNAQSPPFGKGKDNASTSNGNVQSSPFGNASSFSAGDSTFTLVVKQHESHKIPQFVPPSSMLDPLLQWKFTLDYLGKVGDACHFIDAELSKLKSAKDKLLALAVPAWSVKNYWLPESHTFHRLPKLVLHPIQMQSLVLQDPTSTVQRILPPLISLLKKLYRRSMTPMLMQR